MRDQPHVQPQRPAKRPATQQHLRSAWVLAAVLLAASGPAAAAKAKPAPTPPPPAPDRTLVLASASANAVPTDGQPCAVSGDGSKVLFSARSGALVSGDSNGEVDLFLKDLNGNGVQRVVAAAAPLSPVFCLGMTPDAKNVVYTLVNPSILPAIQVKNLLTGSVTQVTPPLASLPNVAGYQFAGISDDGLRLAFIAQPTSTSSGYDTTALGPARMLLRDLGTGQLINLEAQVRFTTEQGRARGSAQLAPDGRSLAFASCAPHPETGDNSGKCGVFSHQLDTGLTRLVSTTAAGQPVQVAGSFNPSFGLQAVLPGSNRVVFRLGYDTNAGLAGIYIKDLASGALTRVLDPSVTYGVGDSLALSFSGDGSKVAYIASTGNSQSGQSLAVVRHLASGILTNAATLSNGTVGNGNTSVGALLSRDGSAVAFGNNATNLVAGAATVDVRTYRKLLP